MLLMLKVAWMGLGDVKHDIQITQNEIQPRYVSSLKLSSSLKETDMVLLYRLLSFLLASVLRWVHLKTIFSIPNIDIFVYNTNIAAFELIPVEAMSSGCAVVVSNVGALPEVVQEGAILTDNTEKGFYDAIKKLLEDKNLMLKYKKRGRKRSKELTWDTCAKKYMKVYDKVLGLS